MFVFQVENVFLVMRVSESTPQKTEKMQIDLYNLYQEKKFYIETFTHSITGLTGKSTAKLFWIKNLMLAQDTLSGIGNESTYTSQKWPFS